MNAFLLILANATLLCCVGSGAKFATMYNEPPQISFNGDEVNLIEDAKVAREGDCNEQCSVKTQFRVQGQDIEIIENYQNGLSVENRQTDLSINGQSGYSASPTTHLFSVAPVVQADNGEFISSRYFFSGGVFVYDDKPHYYIGNLDYFDYLEEEKNAHQFRPIAAREQDAAWEYNNVNWFYVQTTNESLNSHHGQDGTIEYQNGEWSASFDDGAVGLKGQVDGIYVYGDFDAQNQNGEFKGKFIGMDGDLEGDAQTAGVFGGMSAEGDAAMAGGWFNTDHYMQLN